MQERYKLETVSRACTLLCEFRENGESLTLSELESRTGIERTICFRLLRTLEDEGFVRKAEKWRYASNITIAGGKAVSDWVCFAGRELLLNCFRAGAPLGDARASG